MRINASTPKGFRDFLPAEARKRQYLLNKIKEVFERYGFEPLETPALEFTDVLKGKYGEDEKLIYEFETKGGDRVALRYDQTVPLARVIAQYDFAKPFKRYQIQPVWRGENTQKGRYREFLQCDADIIGSSSSISDAEILALVLDIYESLGLDIQIKINDRTNFDGIDKKYISSIDKLEKIGEEGVVSEMVKKGLAKDEAEKILKDLKNKFLTKPLQDILADLKTMGKDVGKVNYSPTLARGLDYYTGMIFETVAESSSGSICSGGRWDEMIGNFTNESLPAVGFGLGFDRTLEVLEEKKLIPQDINKRSVLVTVFSSELSNRSLELVSILRKDGIPAEIYLGDNYKMNKQLKYADQKGIGYVAIIGPKEAEKDAATIKNLTTGDQTLVSLENVSSQII